MNTPERPSAWAYFLFNAGIGTLFCVAGSFFGFLGLLFVLSIIAAPQGLGLLVLSLVLWLCGARLVFGALVGREKQDD